MTKQYTRIDILDAIRLAARELGQPLSRSRFIAHSGISEYRILKHFPSWREALKASGVEINDTNVKLEDDDLLRDWGDLVRRRREIPTRMQYRREGNYSPGTFAKHFGPWSTIPEYFRRFAKNKQEWVDVLALLPIESNTKTSNSSSSTLFVSRSGSNLKSGPQYSKFEGRPTYGNPIDFRGLRHEPVNESG